MSCDVLGIHEKYAFTLKQFITFGILPKRVDTCTRPNFNNQKCLHILGHENFYFNLLKHFANIKF